MSRTLQSVDPHTLSLGVICPFKDGQTLDLDYFFSQDYIDITQAAREVPAAIEWTNATLQYMYQEDKLNLEAELSEARAKAYFDLKNYTFGELYGGKPTEKGLEAAVNLNDEVQDIRRRLNVAKGWVQRLSNLQQSFQTKLDLIRSSEATRRRLIEPAELELDRERIRRRQALYEDNNRDNNTDEENE